jgi:hypothetical protein
MRSVFRDVELNRQFTDNGYVVVPFLAATEIAQLRRFFDDLHPNKLPAAVYPSVMYRDAEYRKAVRDAIWALFGPKITAMFDCYRPCIAGFIAEEPTRKSSGDPLHVDPSFTDERQFMEAVTVWCPLSDVTAANSCLQIVPGSHHHAFPLRPFASGGPGGHPFDDVMPLLNAKYAQNIEIAAGEAIIHSSKSLHDPGPNTSRDRRLTSACIIAPQEAPLRYLVPVSSTEAEVFEVDEAFFWTHQLGTRPTNAKSLGVVACEGLQFSEADVLRSPHLRPAPPASSKFGGWIKSWTGWKQ